ncbi:MAG: NUDIX domain-containing protein [Roseiflexaceae bacterium]
MPTVGVFAAIFDQQGRILCVKLNYGPLSWTTPGGRVEDGESPVAALIREIHEESGYHAQVEHLVGVYAAPFKDDIVLMMAATIIDSDGWAPNGEIAQIGFFARDALPGPMNPRVQHRILDAFAGRSGVLHVFEAEYPQAQ